MEIFICITIFIFGIILGSFYNVVGYRLPKGDSLISPSSHCVNCNHYLSWYELIPVFSYIFLKGKCKKCHSKISIIYPLVELITGLLFVICYIKFGLSINFIKAILISSLFIIVSISDIRYMIIPDEITYSFATILAALDIVSFGLLKASEHILSGVILFILMYLIMLLGNFLFKKESLGGADIKLMLITGITLGLSTGFLSIFVASLLALIPSIIIIITKKDHAFPFGPFLTGAVLLIFLTGLNLNTVYELFNSFLNFIGVI